MNKSELLAAIKARPECLYFVAESHGDSPTLMFEASSAPKVKDYLHRWTWTVPGTKMKSRRYNESDYTYYWVYLDQFPRLISWWCRVDVSMIREDAYRCAECLVRTGDLHEETIHGYVCDSGIGVVENPIVVGDALHIETSCVEISAITESQSTFELSRPSYIVERPKAELLTVESLYQIIITVCFMYALSNSLALSWRESLNGDIVTHIRKAGWCKTTHIRGRVYMHVRSNATPRAKRINDVLSGRFMPRVSVVGCH